MAIGTTAAILMLAGSGLTAASSIYKAKKENAAYKSNTQLQTEAATRAAELQATAAARASEVEEKSNADLLAFYREQAAAGSGGGGGGGYSRDPVEDARYDAAVALEAQRYKEKKELEAQRYGEAVARRQPYMNLGLGALAQMGSAPPSGAQNTLSPQSQGAMVSAGTVPYAAKFSETPPPVGSLSDILAKKQQTGAGA